MSLMRKRFTLKIDQRSFFTLPIPTVVVSTRNVNLPKSGISLNFSHTTFSPSQISSSQRNIWPLFTNGGAFLDFLEVFLSTNASNFLVIKIL